jgi:L-alanine-DL-glutamate epimerase-like enolase superfamily enzyme
MAEAAGMLITPHVSGGIQYAHVLMLASFTPNMGKYQELKVGYKETKDFFTTDLVLKDGKINIPNGVGLGMAFDKNYLIRLGNFPRRRSQAHQDVLILK